ncbi:MAG: zinc ABC transporter substrate-binding protein [Thermodesulforhabdaceae bacterium]
MGHFRVSILLFAFFSFLGILGVERGLADITQGASPAIVVAVSIPPQKFFVEQIGGNRVQVVTLIPQGADPHTYEPKPKDIDDLQKAKLYFAIGYLDVEKIWLDRLKKRFPQMSVINITYGVVMKEGHSHRDGGEHHLDSDGVDPHVWLSPPLVMLQSRNIYQALVYADPEGRAFYSDNFKNWMTRLVALDVELASMFYSFKGRSFLVYHPAWSYFAETYGLNQLAVEKEGKSPGPRDLERLKAEVKENGIKVLFVSSDVPSVAEKNISKELGVDLDVLNPLVYDWESNMRNVAAKLVSSMKR